MTFIPYFLPKTVKSLFNYLILDFMHFDDKYITKIKSALGLLRKFLNTCIFLWPTFTTRYHLCLKLANCGAYFNELSFFPIGSWTCISENRLQLSHNSLRIGIGICT